MVKIFWELGRTKLLLLEKGNRIFSGQIKEIGCVVSHSPKIFRGLRPEIFMGVASLPIIFFFYGTFFKIFFN